MKTAIIVFLLTAAYATGWLQGASHTTLRVTLVMGFVLGLIAGAIGVED